MDRRADTDIRARLDEIESGYIQRADENHALIDELMRRTFVLLAALVVISLVSGAVATVNWTRISDRQRENKATIMRMAALSSSTNDSLCALRGDLEQRIDSSTRFLQEHPEGVPGIPPKLIRDGIANQSRTVRALRSLDCG